MSKAPAYQFYPGDYIQDTRVLSLPARGAWQDLLCFMWRSEEKGKISYSMEEYTRLFGASIEETKCVIDELISLKICDTVTECNGNVTLINRRMVREEQARKQTNNRVKRFRNAKEKRHCNESVTSPSSSSSSFSSSSSLTTTTKEEDIKEKEVKEKEKASTDKPPPLILPKDIDPDVWEGFKEMRKKAKAPLTVKACELIIIELYKIGQNKNDVLNQSIRNSWKDVYALHSRGGSNENRSNSRRSSRESTQEKSRSGYPGEIFEHKCGDYPEDHREVATC